MGKQTSGSSGATTGGTIFTTSKIGSGSVGLSSYVDLGVIPTGWAIWFGTLQVSSPNKSVTFEVRSSLTGQSAGTDGSTKLLSSITASKTTATLDMYKSGTLHTVSVLGTGTEHFWIKPKSTSSTSGSYSYTLYYTLG